jgi:type I restriction enzyme M protein
LIFLKYADHRFAQAERELAGKARRRGAVGKDDYHARGVVYVPEKARFRGLLELPEGADIGKAINEGMKAIEAENDDLRDVLPKTYGRFDAQTLKELLKLFSTIPEDVEGDVFGRIYEYFLGNFAPRTLQKGGEYFTPYSVVRLIVEVVEPYHGRIYDPACGSGGMFVQSASFVAAHEKRPADEISVYGIEKIQQTLRLARMNLAVHGPVGGHQGGEHLLRGGARAGGPFRLRHGEPAVQPERGGQGAAEGRPEALPVRDADGRQCELSVDPALF